MRSRASGGICGDSSAAPSAATMSSLRRRAICVTRARSIARSSTGGRASARTTAPASPGSTSSRSQASRSRTSARWKNAAAPDSRYGTARSSNATATAWPSPRTERTSTQTSSGATSSRATSRSTSAATACACARSEAQRQNATSPPGSPCELLVDPLRPTGSTTARAARRICSPAADATRSSRDDRRARPLGAEVVDVLGRGAAEAVDRLVVVGGRGDVAVAGRRAAAAAGPGRSSRPGARRRARAGGGGRAARARARFVRRMRKACRTRSPTSSVAGVGEHPLVRGVERGELALAGAVLGQRRRPTRRSRRPTTSSSLRRSIRWTIAPSVALGLPRRSWWRSGSSSIRSSSIASRSAAPTGVANGSSPASSASSRSSRAQKPWNVVTASSS